MTCGWGNFRQLVSSLEIGEGDFIELSSKDGTELVRANADLVRHAKAIAVDGTGKTADEIAESQREVAHQKLLLDAVDVAVLTAAATGATTAVGATFGESISDISKEAVTTALEVEFGGCVVLLVRAAIRLVKNLQRQTPVSERVERLPEGRTK